MISILNNLIVNSVDAIENAGHITIEVKEGVDKIEYPGLGEIQLIYSNNYSRWDNIVFLGLNALVWDRKISKTLPQNIRNYTVHSNPDEHRIGSKDAGKLVRIKY